MAIKKKHAIAIIFSFVLVSVFLSVVAKADVNQIQLYKIHTTIDEDGRSFVSMTITFKAPEEQFSLRIIGRVENLEASSNAGPVNCDVDISGISDITCKMALTKEKRELRLNFETTDFIKELDEKIYFSGDFTTDMSVSVVSSTIKLPKKYLPFGDISSSILSYSENASAYISGDSIFITWGLSDISEKDKIKFEILYEQVDKPVWWQFRMRHFILFGAVLAVVLGFIIVRYLRKSEKLVLSVLDEYERKVIDIIIQEGEVKQRQVVKETNFSKAKVSRVVKSLKNRGLIEVERRGRTNRLKLVKNKLKGEV